MTNNLRSLVAGAVLLMLLAGCGSEGARDYGIKRISVLVGRSDSSYPGQALVWDAEAKDFFSLGGDYRAEVTMWCDQVWNAGADSAVRTLDLPLQSNVIVKGLVGQYTDPSYRIEQSAPACLMDKELVGGLVTVSHYERIPEDTVTQVAVPELQIFCIYDLHRDSLIFVDSLHSRTANNRGAYSFRQAYLTRDGRSLVYEKRNNALRFDISAERIDTVETHAMPVVPVNSNEIITCNRAESMFHAYDSTLAVTGEIEEYAWQLFSAYKIADNVFVVGIEEQPPWNHGEEYMWVSIFDFNRRKYIRLFLVHFGQILNVEMES
jgi:hypothetical protein